MAKDSGGHGSEGGKGKGGYLEAPQNLERERNKGKRDGSVSQAFRIRDARIAKREAAEADRKKAVEAGKTMLGRTINLGDGTRAGNKATKTAKSDKRISDRSTRLKEWDKRAEKTMGKFVPNPEGPRAKSKPSPPRDT